MVDTTHVNTAPSNDILPNMRKRRNWHTPLPMSSEHRHSSSVIKVANRLKWTASRAVKSFVLIVVAIVSSRCFMNPMLHATVRNRAMDSVALSARRQRSLQYINIYDLNVTHEFFDVVIVGCGPAGLTAALFASRFGLSVLVIGSPSAGALAGTVSLNNFPSYFEPFGGGKEWLDATLDQASIFGASFMPPTFLATSLVKKQALFEVGISNSDEADSVQVHAKTVIIASGSIPRKLNLPHETDLWGRSLHNCALCDAESYGYKAYSSINSKVSSDTGKSVVVIGGGDAAVEAVSMLAQVGAYSIHLIHRREEFKANAAELQKVRSLPNVQIWTPFVVVEWILKESIVVEAKSSLVGVRIVGSIDGIADLTATSSIEIPCDGAFLMMGSTPNTDWLKDSGIELDTSGLVLLRNPDASAIFLSTQTSLPGVFAAGEAVDGIYRQALTAASDGSKSAMDAERYLRYSGALSARESVNREALKKSYIDSGVINNKSEPLFTIDCDLSDSTCISKVVSAHHVVVFSKSFCSHCHRAIEALRSEGVTPLIIELDYIPDGGKIQDILIVMTGRRTVPNVFINGRSIGGGDETVKLQRNGGLTSLLRSS